MALELCADKGKARLKSKLPSQLCVVARKWALLTLSVPLTRSVHSGDLNPCLGRPTTSGMLPTSSTELSSI